MTLGAQDSQTIKLSIPMAYTSPHVAELLAQHNALEKQLAEAREKETRLALIEIVQKMREYKITLHELVGRKAPAVSDSGEPESLVKYRDPVTGATWSGRGRAPRWIIGKDRDEFLVTARASARRPAASSQGSLFSEDT
jgi:DNA-binding protein H-NS